MKYMFTGCTSLSQIDIKTLNTTNVADMSCMFYECSNLKSIDLSGLNMSNVKTVFGMFLNCKSLNNVDISGINTSNVTNFGSMFSGCSALEKLDVSSINTSNATDIGSMFRDCHELKKIDLSGFNTSKVENISFLFFNCTYLKSINLNGWDTSHVNEMYHTFQLCTSLRELDLSMFDTSKTSAAVQLFAHCANLEKIYASEKWDMETHIVDANGIFDGCWSLVGQNGTRCNVYGSDVLYARIDKIGKAGYFSSLNSWKISGKVENWINRPLKEVKVELLSSNVLGSQLISTTYTDELGQYEFSINYSESFIIKAEKDDKIGYVYPYVKDKDITDANIILDAPDTELSLSGTIKDQFGNAISNSTIRLLNDNNEVVHEVKSTSDGKYEITSISMGKYTLKAIYEGCTGSRQIGIRYDSITNADIVVLLPTYIVSGKILSKSGKVLKNIPINLVSQNKIVNSSVVSDKEGVYSFSDILDGIYEMCVSYEGIQKKINVTVNGSNVTEDIILEIPEKTYFITGRVIDQNNDPLSGAEVEIVAEGEDEGTKVITDENGKYTAGSLSNGTYTIQAVYNDFTATITAAVRFRYDC